ncbi:hypothetical protein EDC36_104202 [Tepidimonas ignava]|uniref:Uncharacterized protein n=1 Tax=Tepidimonas ignava TaxID=114249 RepID=A0A4R3LH03_9BURK|nr:hypothetical protein EDC36_104202 [Tepidimonas ignava]
MLEMTERPMPELVGHSKTLSHAGFIAIHSNTWSTLTHLNAPRLIDGTATHINTHARCDGMHIHGQFTVPVDGQDLRGLTLDHWLIRHWTYVIKTSCSIP